MNKINILYYHAHFFSGSETFIYQQAINPHIHASLLAKRYINSSGLPLDAFTKLNFRRTWWDGLVSNLLFIFGVDQYYQHRSISILTKLISSQSIDVLHAQFGFNAIRILPVAKALQIPLVVSFHGLDASKLLRKRSYRNGVKKVFNYASAIVICNPAMVDALPLTHKQKDKVVWIPYGIDTQKFSGIVHQAHSNPQLLHVGRLVEKKGVPDLIRAFSKITLQNVKPILHLVGTGPQENICRTLVKELALEDQVQFHGWKSPEEVKQLMQLCDLFILNSRIALDGDSEGLPVGLLEAMAMGMPVISTRHAGIPLAIDDGVNGILVSEHDTDALTQAIKVLLTNEEKRHSIAVAARKKIEERFTIQQMHEKLYEIYSSALDKRQ